jgi:hypothetical protein
MMACASHATVSAYSLEALYNQAKRAGVATQPRHQRLQSERHTHTHRTERERHGECYWRQTLKRVRKRLMQQAGAGRGGPGDDLVVLSCSSECVDDHG